MRRAVETFARFVTISAILCIPLSVSAQDQPSGTQPTQPPLKVCSAKNPPPCATTPRPIYRPQAEYNDKARKKKINGTVILGTTVGTDGHTHDIHVMQSVGYGLDEQAVKALSQWTFEPGTKDGHPVPVALEIEMDFRIR